MRDLPNFSIPPQRFRVSFESDEVTFNVEVALDVMWIDQKAVLHVVDLETNFTAATFLKHQKVDGVWNSFISCCVAL